MTMCANCGEEVILFNEAGPWVHADNFAVECQHPTEAEPEVMIKPQKGDTLICGEVNP